MSDKIQINTKNFTTFYIVRHGETHANIQGITQGQSESELTSIGEAQAKILSEELKNVTFDAIFSSDLVRAQRTAEILVLQKKLVINTSKLLRERSWGKYEGKSHQIFVGENKHLIKKLEKLSEQEKHSFKFGEDIESDKEILTRFITFLREAGATYIGKTVLIVSHGGLMRVLLTHLGYARSGQLPPGSVKNTGYFKLLSDGVEFFLMEVKGVDKKTINI